MLKVFSGTIIVIAVLISTVVVIGIRAGEDIDTELVVKLPYSQSYVYEIFTNIESFTYYKKNLENIEILERDGKQIIKWRENYKNGDWKKYEITQKSSPNIFDYKIYDSYPNYTAEFTFTFNQDDEFTEIIMTEKGKINNLFKRGIRRVLLDDFNLKREAKWLRVAILEEQIDRN